LYSRQRSLSYFHAASLKGEIITQNRESILYLFTRKACFITALFLLPIGQVGSLYLHEAGSGQP
jgi:hypothetical protein